jgi:4'-phosphopantetheinyl transferase
LTVTASVIHVWRAWLDQPQGLVRQLAQGLAPDEHRRAQAFVFPPHRESFIISRAFLRTVLGRYLLAGPRDVRLIYGPYGKPALAGAGENLQFNLAHSQGIAVLAITRFRPIGIDIEKIRPLASLESIVEKNFSPRECAAFRALPPISRLSAFFKAWTQKEAYLKALGVGLSHPLETFDVSFGSGQPLRLPQTGENSDAITRWSLWELSTAPGYASAVAAEGPVRRVVCWQWCPRLMGPAGPNAQED